MFMRRRAALRPVVRPVGAPLLRGAIVGGTAYAVGKHAANNARQEQDQNAAIQDLQAQQVAARQPVYEAPPAPAGGNVTDELARLGQLQQQGLLTPEEFAAAKARLLGLSSQ